MIIPLQRPADSSGELVARLAIQQRTRETALRRLRKLRKKAEAEIDRLIAFLDQSDEYVMTELEDDDFSRPGGRQPGRARRSGGA